MNIPVTLLILTLFIASTEANVTYHYNQLYAHITNTANKHGLPVENVADPVEVKVDLAINRIMELDPGTQSLHSMVWVRIFWNDASITWSPEDFGNITSMNLSPLEVWIPDIIIYNAIDQSTVLEDITNFNLIVDNKGNMTWLYPLQVISMCEMNVKLFPFDTQICKLKIGSWMYHGLQLHIANMSSQLDLSSLIPNGAWIVDNAPVIPWTVYYGCCVEPYHGLTVEIHLTRMPKFFIYTICFPTMLMLIILLFGSLMPSESEGKSMLGITIILTQIVLALIVNEYIPVQSRETPLIGVILLLVLIDMTFFLLMNMLVLSFHKAANGSSKPPCILSLIAHNKVILLCMFPFKCREKWERFKLNTSWVSCIKRKSSIIKTDITVEKQSNSNTSYLSRSCEATLPKVIVTKESSTNEKEKQIENDSLFESINEYELLAMLFNRFANIISVLLTLLIVLWIIVLALLHPVA